MKKFIAKKKNEVYATSSRKLTNYELLKKFLIYDK